MVYGASSLKGRTVESHVREFEKTKIVGEETVEEVAEKIKEYLFEKVKKDMEDVSKIPEHALVVGCQVAGYNKEDVKIGNN